MGVLARQAVQVAGALEGALGVDRDSLLQRFFLHLSLFADSCYHPAEDKAMQRVQTVPIYLATESARGEIGRLDKICTD